MNGTENMPESSSPSSLTAGRPCAQCQSRHLSCDRQRPCRRCVEAGPGLAMHCCDPVDAPRKRGRPPGMSRKRRRCGGDDPLSASGAAAVSLPPLLFPAAPKRPRVEPLPSQVPVPLQQDQQIPSHGVVTQTHHQPALPPYVSPPAPAPTRTTTTGPWERAPDPGSGQQQQQLAAAPQQPVERRPPSEPDVMRAILHEIRELRSVCTSLGAQVAELSKRQATTDQRFDSVERQCERMASVAAAAASSSLLSSTVMASPSTLVASFHEGIAATTLKSASWQDIANLINSTSNPHAPFMLGVSPSPASMLPSQLHQALLRPQLFSPPSPPISPTSPSSPSFSSSPPSIPSFSSSSSCSPSSSSSLLPYLASPPLPPSVSLQAFDPHHPRVLAVLPQNQLSSSFDRPWFIERMADTREYGPHQNCLPKHQFSDPELAQIFGTKRPLVVAANDQFRQLMRYSWGELHELNTTWFYPPSVNRVLGVWYRDWIGKRQPACLSPVFLATCPAVTRDGQFIHTLLRTQLYYNEHGDYSWSLSVLEYWHYAHDHDDAGARQVHEELEALLRDCHPSPIASPSPPPPPPSLFSSSPSSLSAASSSSSSQAASSSSSSSSGPSTEDYYAAILRSLD